MRLFDVYKIKKTEKLPQSEDVVKHNLVPLTLLQASKEGALLNKSGYVVELREITSEG